MATPRRYHFGPFELDPRSGELRGPGGLVRLQEQPLQTLLLLIERQGEVVTRDELRQRLWPDDTFVDYEHGLHAVVSRLRDALGDSSEKPAFIETLPRRGYRLLVAAEAVEAQGGLVTQTTPLSVGRPSDTDSPARVAVAPEASPSRAAPARRWLLVSISALAAAGIVAGWRMVPTRPTGLGRAARLAVLPFDNFTGDPDQQFFVDGLGEELTYRLGQIHPQHLAVIGRTSVQQYKHTPKTIAEVARDLRVDYVLEGSVRRAAPRVRITAQLIRGSDQSHVWTESYEQTWSDLLAIQKDIGARVAESLTLELVPAYQAQMDRDATVAAATYEQYLKGLFLGISGPGPVAVPDARDSGHSRPRSGSNRARRARRSRGRIQLAGLHRRGASRRKPRPGPRRRDPGPRTRRPPALGPRDARMDAAHARPRLAGR